MSRKSRGQRNTSPYTENRGTRTQRENNGIYIYGNTVRKPELREQLEEPVRQPNVDVRKNREKAHHMSAGYVFFLGAALVTAALILVNYLQLQADLNNLMKSVATRQGELSKMRDDNDEEYNRIVSGIDLEEVKRVAMGVLGMTYAQEDQIKIYQGGQYDYMRQVTDDGR